MARGPPQDCCRLDAHGLLRWIVSGGIGQLPRGCALRLARDVCDRGIARAPGRFYSLRREGIEALGECRISGPRLVDLASVRGAVFARIPQAHDPELQLCSHLDYRAVGRLCVCPRGRERNCRAAENSRRAGDAPGFARDHALAIATIFGCIILPIFAERLGRRVTLALYFICMMLSISIGFGYVFYLPQNTLNLFFICLVFLGLGGANFAMYTLWLPEQYPTACRGTAFAFATSVGRFVGAGFTFLVGAGVAHYRTIGFPVALTCLAFVVGLVLLPFGFETKGKPLPA